MSQFIIENGDRRRFEDYVAACERLRTRSALVGGRLSEIRVVSYTDLRSGKADTVVRGNVLDEWVDSFAFQMRKFHNQNDSQHFETTRNRVGYVLNSGGETSRNAWLEVLTGSWNAAVATGWQAHVYIPSARKEGSNWADLGPKAALDRWFNGHWAHQTGDTRRERDGVAALVGLEALDGAKALHVLARRVEPVLKLGDALEDMLQGNLPSPTAIEQSWARDIVVPPLRTYMELGPNIRENAEAIIDERVPERDVGSILDELAKK